MTLERREQDGEQRLQSLPTNAIRGLPQNDQRLAYGLVVQAPPTATFDARLSGASVEHPNGVLAMVASEGDELIQDPTLLVHCARPIPPGDCVNQLLLRLCTDLRHRASFGSKQCEATILAE